MNINYTLMHIRDAGQDAGGVSLNGSTGRQVSGDTITMTLDQSLREAIEGMDMPQLDIGMGAVADMAGNPVRNLDDWPVSLVRFAISQLSEITLGDTLRAYESGGHHYVAGYYMDRYYGPLDGGSWSVRIHNISDPVAPASMGDVDQGTLPRLAIGNLDYYARDGRSYLAVTGTNLAVYDVTDPSSATKTDTLSYSRHNPYGISIYSLAEKPYALLPSGYYRNGVVHIADLADPSDLMAEGEISRIAGVFHLRHPQTADTFVIEDSTYAVIGSSTDGDVQLLNVTDPGNPALAGFLYPSGHVISSTACIDVEALTIGGGPWVAASYCSRLFLIDVSDPDNPVVVSLIHDNPTLLLDNIREISALKADGRTYLVVASDRGVEVLDVSDPFRMEQVASLPLRGGGIDSFEAEGSAYAAHTKGVLGLVPYLPSDRTPPTVAEAVYNPGSDILRIDFSEPVAFPVDSSLLHVRDQNQSSGGVTLSGSPPVKGLFITFQLNATEAATLDMMNSAQLDVDTGAVSDLAGNQIQSASDMPVAIKDPIPPRLEQTTYTSLTRTLNVTFDEPINGTVNAGLLNVRETGDPLNVEVPLFEATLDRVAGHSAYFVLDARQAAILNRMDAPQLDVDAGAVFDDFGNPAHAAADQDIAVVDSVPPTPLSAVYYLDRGVLRITFSELLNETSTPQTGMLHLREQGQISGGVTADSGYVRDHSVYLTFIGNRSAIWTMTNPILDIDAGAVTDKRGNPVAKIQDLPVASISFNTGSVSSAGLQGSFGYSGMDTFGIGDSIYLAAAMTNPFNNGIQVINVTDPASPAVAGNNTDDLRPREPATIKTFETGGLTYAVASAWRTLHVVNVTDPSSPAPVGNATAIAQIYDIDTFQTGDRIWAAAITYTSYGRLNSIQLFDVTDPASPATAGNLTSQFRYPFGSASSLDIFEVDGRTYAVGLGSSGPLVANVTDPYKPEWLAYVPITSDIGSVETFVSGDDRTYALILHGNWGGMTVLDIANPVKPVPVAEMSSTDHSLLTYPQAASILTVDNRTYALIISDHRSSSNKLGVLVVDLTDPYAPYDLSSSIYRNGINGIEVFVADGRAYMALAEDSTIDLRRAGSPGQVFVQQEYALVPHSAFYQPGGQSDQNSGIGPKQPSQDGQSGGQHYDESLREGGKDASKEGEPVRQAGSQGGQLVITFSGPINGTVLPERLHIRNASSIEPINGTVLPERLHIRNASSLEPAFALSGQPKIIHENTTIIFALDPDQDGILQNMTLPLLDIRQGAVYDPGGNPIMPFGIPIQILDMIPPTLDSAVYDTETLRLAMQFSEHLNHTATDYNLLSLLGPSSNITLAQVGEPAAANGTITVRLNMTHLDTLGGAPSTLTIQRAAVYDLASNPIRAATIPVITPDIVPPTILYASLLSQDGLGGLLEIVFSEYLNHTATNYTRIMISGDLGNLTLNHIDEKIPFNDTLVVIFDQTHMDALGTPISLHTQEAAFSDMAGNPASASVSILPDVLPPEVFSAIYDASLDILGITFSEPLDHNRTDYSGLVLDLDTLNMTLANLTLADAYALAASNDTIAARFDPALPEDAIRPVLRVGNGSVYDIAGNPIAADTIRIVAGSVTPLVVELGYLAVGFAEAQASGELLVGAAGDFDPATNQTDPIPIDQAGPPDDQDVLAIDPFLTVTPVTDATTPINATTPTDSTVSPTITLLYGEAGITLPVGAPFNGLPPGYVQCHDHTGTDISDSIVSDGTVDTSTPGTYTITYTCTDSNSLTDTIQITVEVLPAANSPPSVDAGPDRTIQEGSTVQLDGIATDPDDDPLTYRWTHDSALKITLSNSTAPSVSFVAPQVSSNTTVTFTLTADDGTDIASDHTTVIITDTASDSTDVTGKTTTNLREISGMSLSSTRPGEIDASWDAPADTPVDYRISWAKVGEKFLPWRDSTGNAFPDGTSHTIDSLEEGETYKVKVRARYDGDTNGPWSDKFTIMVAANRPPVANAGDDLTLSGGEQATLVGSATDPDGDSLTYQWLQNPTNAGVVFGTPNSLTTTITAPQVSATTQITILLRVSDGTDHHTDQLLLVVNATTGQ